MIIVDCARIEIIPQYIPTSFSLIRNEYKINSNEKNR